MGDNGGAQFMAKGTLYENGIRVPFMIRWPGRIAPAVTDAVVSNVDIASTCLAAAGLPVPEEIEGEDLLPLMTQGETPAERWVYSVRSCHATNSLPGKTSVFDQMRCIGRANGTNSSTTCCPVCRGCPSTSPARRCSPN